eukprot:6139130-Amphidinium_carterae.1
MRTESKRCGESLRDKVVTERTRIRYAKCWKELGAESHLMRLSVAKLDKKLAAQLQKMWQEGVHLADGRYMYAATLHYRPDLRKQCPFALQCLK